MKNHPLVDLGDGEKLDLGYIITLILRRNNHFRKYFIHATDSEHIGIGGVASSYQPSDVWAGGVSAIGAPAGGGAWSGPMRHQGGFVKAASGGLGVSCSRERVVRGAS